MVPSRAANGQPAQWCVTLSIAYGCEWGWGWVNLMVPSRATNGLPAQWCVALCIAYGCGCGCKLRIRVIA